ncbi:hypothetical protein HYU94_02320 [Candidatus Daviesbacteria bacterium]|nr:hypothetical protein [Candidatus Daviesbacteria bacterium]
MNKKSIIIANFLGGLAWGLGTVIGATIVAAIIISILRLFNFIPGLSELLDSLPKSPR